MARATGWGLAATLAALLAAMFAAMRLSGAWFDEFYTLFVTRDGPAFGDLLTNQWLTDNHPPLFYALAWATNWLGDSAEARRLVNLPVLIATAGLIAFWAVRMPGQRRVLALFGLGLAGAAPTLAMAAELRSYFLAMAASALAIVALMIHAGFRRADAPARGNGLVLAGTLTLACNLHYVTALLVGAIAMAFLLRLALAHAWRQAGPLLLACALAAIPLVLTMLLQFRHLEANTRDFWITGGWQAGVRITLGVLGRTLIANPVLTVTGLAGLALLAVESRRARSIEPRLDLVLVLGAGCISGLLLLLAIQAWRPVMAERYLYALFPAVILALAIGTATLWDRLTERRASAIAIAIALASIAGIAVNLRATLARESWYDTAREIAVIAKRCPGTVVHAEMGWNPFIIRTPPAANPLVTRFAYRSVADRFGFSLEAPESRRMASHCPTVFWAEGLFGPAPGQAEIVESLSSRGFALGRVTMRGAGDGWLLTSEP